VAGWSILLLVIVAIETRSYPIQPDATPPTTGIVPPASLLWWLFPIGLAALLAGIIGGAVVRRRRRWYELLVVAAVIGGTVSFVSFDVWFNAHAAPPDCTASNPCDIAYGIGAMLAAVPETLIFVAGALLARGIVASITHARR
jgi:hypothetical protein